MVLQEVLEAARVVAVMLNPIVPALARLIYLQLGFSDQQFEALTWEDAQWGGETCLGHVTMFSVVWRLLWLPCLLVAALPASCCSLDCLLVIVGPLPSAILHTGSGVHMQSQSYKPLSRSTKYVPNHCNLIACTSRESHLCRQYAGLKAGQATAKPKPIFVRLEGDFVTTMPDVPLQTLAEAKA